MHSSNSYATTSIIMSQHSFSASFASLCRNPSFHVATISIFRLCCNTVLFYPHFCRDLKSLSQQRLVSTKLDFLLQLHYDIATWLLGVVNICCRYNTLLCSAYSFWCDPVCYVATELLCIVLNSLSRPRFSLFSLFLCCDIKIHVAT